MPHPRHAAVHLLAAALLWLGGCASNRPAEEAFGPESLGVTDRVRHYQAEIRRNPEDPELHYRLGNALLDMGRYQDAYRSYQGAIQLKRDHADAYANLGLALRRMGQLKAAAGAYVQALELNPGDRTTLTNLLVVAELMEDWDRVEWCLERLAMVDPNDPGLIAARADVLHRLGRPAEAAPLYEAAAKSADPARNLYRAGLCYADLLQWPRAVALWELARAAEPENPSINRGLAVAHWEAGNPAAARAAIARCEELDIPLDPEFLRQVNSDPNLPG